jgi:hypothetical protein
MELSNKLARNGEQVLLGKKTNMLLVKDDVGRAKPTTRDLPQDNFAFGKPDLLASRETCTDGKSKRMHYNLHLAYLKLSLNGKSIKTPTKREPIPVTSKS